MAPEGWRTVLLDSVSMRGSGHTPKKDVREYWNGPIKWVSLADSWRLDQGYITDTNKTITERGIEHSSAVVHPAGTVVMTRDAGVGKSAVLNSPMAVSQHFMAWDCSRSEELHNWYLYHWLQYEKPEFERIAVGSTIKTIGLPYFKGLRIPLPPIDQQRHIAGVLATWDVAISTSEKLLDNHVSQKLALLAELLMPVPVPRSGRVAGDAYPQSVQSGTPNLPPARPGWGRSTFGDHLTEVARPAVLAKQQPYTLVTVRRSRGGVDKRGELLGSQIKTPTQFYVKRGDFLISKRQIVHGACGIVPDHLDGAIVSNEYAVLNTGKDLDVRFLAYLAETTYFQQTCFHSSIGVHIEKMLFNLKRWLSWPINVPPIDVQQRIVERLDLATQEIRLAERQVELLKAEKQSLMADLLTGKRRVRVREQTSA